MTRRIALPVLLFSLILAQDAAGQEQKSATSPDRSTIVKVARQVMQEARYCALVTIGQDGHPQSRVVDPFLPGEDMVVWIGTNPITRKVAQIRKDPRVTLFYFDPQDPGYVTILGKAELIKDPAEKARHWKEAWEPFYENGSHGDDFLLIRVKPLRLEVVSYGQGLPMDPVTWLPAMVDFP